MDTDATKKLFLACTVCEKMVVFMASPNTTFSVMYDVDAKFVPTVCYSCEEEGCKVYINSGVEEFESKPNPTFSAQATMLSLAMIKSWYVYKAANKFLATNKNLGVDTLWDRVCIVNRSAILHAFKDKAQIASAMVFPMNDGVMTLTKSLDTGFF